MFPDYNEFTQQSESPDLLPPFTLTFDDLTSYCYGGVAINDASYGLLNATWKARLDGDKVYLTKLPNSEILYYTHSEEADSISLSFDNNMSPILVFGIGNKAVIRFYDSGISGFTIQEIENVRSPKGTIDYFWETYGLDIRDTIVGYIRNDNNMLCYRRSRDRYLMEFEVQQVYSQSILRRVAVTTDKRFVFDLASGLQQTDVDTLNYLPEAPDYAFPFPAQLARTTFNAPQGFYIRDNVNEKFVLPLRWRLPISQYIGFMRAYKSLRRGVPFNLSLILTDGNIADYRCVFIGGTLNVSYIGKDMYDVTASVEAMHI